MAFSPHERLKRIEEHIEQQEIKKEKLADEEKKTDQEIEEAKEAAEKELSELQRDDEVQELSRRIAQLEAQGRNDDAIVAELRKRGVDPQQILGAMRVHMHEHPEHEVQQPKPIVQEENLEDMVGGAPKNTGGNMFYDLQDKLQGGIGGNSLFSGEMYSTLKQMEEDVTRRGEMTKNEYDILNQFEQELREKEGNPYYADQANLYAQRESEVVDSIKRIGGLQIGDNYLGSDDPWQN